MVCKNWDGLSLSVRENEKMSERNSDSSPAHPVAKLNSGLGFTKKEYAAILLKVPDSGTEWLDLMIRKSYNPNS